MKAKYPFVNVLVTSFNRVEYLKCSLEALVQTIEYKHGFVINVIDNGSTDGSVDYLKSLPADYPVKSYFIGENLGFSGGLNFGMSLTADQPGIYYMTLDNDMVPLQNDWLISMIEASLAQSVVHMISYPLFGWDDYARLEFKDHNGFELAEVEPILLWGGIMGIPSQTFEKIGYFDLEHKRDPYLSNLTTEKLLFGIADTLYAYRVSLLAGKIFYMKPFGVFKNLQEDTEDPADDYENLKKSELIQLRKERLFDRLCDAYSSGQKPLKIL